MFRNGFVYNKPLLTEVTNHIYGNLFNLMQAISFFSVYVFNFKSLYNLKSLPNSSCNSIIFDAKAFYSLLLLLYANSTNYWLTVQCKYISFFFRMLFFPATTALMFRLFCPCFVVMYQQGFRQK